MPKGQNNNNRESSLPDLEIEAGLNFNRSTENINKEIDREDTSIEATHENCDTTIEIQEGGLRGLIMGRTETTEIDCEPENEISPESFYPEEDYPDEKEESESGFLIESEPEDESGFFIESEPELESEVEYESFIC